VVNNFDKLQGLKYNHLTSTPKGSTLVLVSGEFIDTTGARPKVLVNWRVISNPDNRPAVMDIEIENISMLITQKQENVAIIRQNKGKFAALIEAMQKQLDQ
jgi:phospholipid transport system substrate-binding protein